MTHESSGRTPALTGATGVVRTGGPESPVQALEVTSRASIETHLCIRPGPEDGDFAAQIDAIYNTLERELKRRGIASGDVVLERVFFTDIGVEFEAYLARHRAFYLREEAGEALVPASIAYQQPPLADGRRCELQVYALRGNSGAVVKGRNVPGLAAPLVGREVETAEMRQVFFSNITSRPALQQAAREVALEDHPAAMFRESVECLEKVGCSFADVVRTWIFLGDIDRDYDALNQARNAFFQAEGISPPPASTGIQGIPYPLPVRWGMGLVAMQRSSGPLAAKQVQTPAMGEAYSYGSNFSRGMTVALEDRTVVYISGTASIDDNNQVVHLDDIEGQLRKMLDNIEQLLASQGCTVDHITSGATYLKRPEYFGPYERVVRSCGFPARFVNTVCEADVCRPEWLCEMEVTAVLPHD